jgi:hypothetical protein
MHSSNTCDMYMCRLRHINDSVLSSLKMEDIRFFFFYEGGLLASRPNSKLEDHPSSALRGSLFNLFTATLHIGGRFSIRNLRTRHAVVTGTHILTFTRSKS